MALLTPPPRTASRSSRRRAVAAALRYLMLGILWFAAGSFFLAGLAAAYSAKRALNIDVVPGVDMLPDERIEEAIRAVLGLIGF